MFEPDELFVFYHEYLLKILLKGLNYYKFSGKIKFITV